MLHDTTDTLYPISILIISRLLRGIKALEKEICLKRRFATKVGNPVAAYVRKSRLRV